jgi:hypothetical protein
LSALKRKLTFLIVVVALAAGAAGAYAATHSSGPSPRQAFLSDVAHRLHVTPVQLEHAIQGALADRLSALVGAGRLTKAQASAIEQRMKSSGRFPGLGLIAIARFGRGMPPGFGRGMRRGFGPGWYAYPPSALPGVKLPPNIRLPPGAKPRAMLPRASILPGPRGPAVLAFPLFGGPAFGFLVPGGVRVAASYLGIRPAELMAELRAGKSLAEIAQAHGRSAGGLRSALDSAVQLRLGHQVAAGHMSKALAGKLRSAIDARVAGLMNFKLPRLPARALLRPLFRPGRSSSAPPGLAG